MAIKQGPPVSFRSVVLMAKLDERGKRNDVAKRDLDRYYALVEWYGSRLSFADAEWSLLRDAFSGTAFADTSPRALPTLIQDAIALDKLDRKWDVEGAALLEKIKALGYAESLALIDAVERWWAANGA